MVNLAKNSLIGVKIVTDYKAVAHLVEGLIVLLFATSNIVVHGLYASFAVFIIYAIYAILFESARGLLLLRDKINDNRNNLKWYLALSFINFLMRHGCGGLFYDSNLLVQVFYFFNEVVLFCYVLRFYWNVGTVSQKINKRNEISHILTSIFTNYRAVAHIVEGSMVCLVSGGFAVYFYFFVGTDPSKYFFYGTYGIFECVKGCLLVRGVIKRNKNNILLYLVLSVFTLVIKMGVVVIFGTLIFQSRVFSVIIAILYFVHEWFFFHCVVKFVRRLDSVEEFGKYANIVIHI